MGITEEMWRMCVQAAMRYRTSMADAMLRACGVTREQAMGVVSYPDTEHDGIMECFRNDTSPIDWVVVPNG